MSNVPCAGCHLCCRNDAVRLLPHEDASKFITEPHPIIPGTRMLAHKPDGDCIYLAPYGCTIHDRKPQLCREMDCRRIAERVKRKHAVDAGMAGVWDRGRELLNQQENA